MEGRDADPLAVTVVPDGSEDGANLPHGTVIGRYLVTAVLGEGGMGVVYAAHDPDLDRPVAIKILRAPLRAARPRLLREGQAVARLSHPNVVTVFDIGAHGDDLFIAMERIRGETFGAWLKEAGDRRRPWRQVLARMVPAGRGLAAAHAAGLVHRDFKPENILLGDDGRVVVTDFGLAQLGGESGERPASLEQSPVTPHLDLTRTGAVLGTPAYMSPEQFRGDRADARSDQFSFCVTLYEALFGVRPIDPTGGFAPRPTGEAGRVPTLHRLASLGEPRDASVPRWLRRAVRRGLRPDPAQRFASMDELLAALTPPRRALAAGLAIGGLGLAAAGVAVAVALLRGDAPVTGVVAAAGCDDAAAEVDALWNDDARALYRHTWSGRVWLDEDVRWLDDYARRWKSHRRAACLAPEPRRDGCLAAAKGALASAAVRTHDLWPALPALDDCSRPPLSLVPLPHAVALGPQGVAVLSPDGKRLAISDLGDPPYLIDTDPAAFRPAPVPGARLVGDWLPDGRLLVQKHDRRQVLRGGPSGAELALPGLGDLLFTQINTISPDGRRLAVQERDEVVVLSVPDGERIADVAVPAHELAWEPDGRRLAIVSRNLSELRLLDTRSGSVVEIELRTHARGLGEIGIAWLAPGRLALTAGFGPQPGTLGLWTLELDDASRLRRAPELRHVPPEGQLLRLFDAAAGRVVVESASSRQRLFRWHVDRSTEYPSHFNELRLGAIDLAAGAAIGFGGGQLVRFDLATGARTVYPGTGHWLPTLRDGVPIQVAPAGRDRWNLVELVPGGPSKQLLSFTWPGGSPFVRCSGRASSRCVIASRERDHLHVAALGPDGPGRIVEHPDVPGLLEVSADGRRVYVPSGDGSIDAIDLATGEIDRKAPVGESDCKIRQVRTHDERIFWVVLLCPDRFTLGTTYRGGEYREHVRSDGWISGAEVLPGGDVLYSVMDWDPQVVLIDGL